MNRLITAGVALIVVLYLLFSSIYVVNVREQAIVLRFGQITAVRTEPGLYFKIPTSFVDSVQIIEDRLLRYDIANMQLQVSDGATYVVDAFLTYRISDPVKFRERVQGDLDLAEQRIATRFDSALRQVYGLRKFDAALSAERPAEAAASRAGGQQAAQSLKAIADRQAVEIVAAANKDSEILRGEGDAQRSAIFAQAYGADPEFFEFYRSLQSYRTALGPTGTTLVLSPSSEFFQYFNKDMIGDTLPTPAAPQGIAPLPSTSAPVEEPSDTLPPNNVGAPTSDVTLPAAPAADVTVPAAPTSREAVTVVP